eukprot:1143662-Prymnesium_polylepis.3
MTPARSPFVAVARPAGNRGSHSSPRAWRAPAKSSGRTTSRGPESGCLDALASSATSGEAEE